MTPQNRFLPVSGLSIVSPIHQDGILSLPLKIGWTRTYPLIRPKLPYLKGQDPRIEMYSAFEDPFGNAPRGQPSLESMLHKHNITDVYVVGLAGDYCVKETVSHSGIKGFRTWVVREGVASVDEGDSGWEEAKKAMEAAGGGGLVKIVGIEGVEVGWVRELSAGIA